MRILATGPESSGTNYLTSLLAAGGADALHRSQPEGPDWIDMAAMLDHFDGVAVIIRGRLAHARSIVRRDIEPDEAFALERRRKALAHLHPVLGHPKAVVVTYESLAQVEERRALLRWFGLDITAADRCPWTDENDKYYP